jgi:hypothetical protein
MKMVIIACHATWMADPDLVFVDHCGGARITSTGISYRHEACFCLTLEYRNYYTLCHRLDLDSIRPSSSRVQIFHVHVFDWSYVFARRTHIPAWDYRSYLCRVGRTLNEQRSFGSHA